MYWSTQGEEGGGARAQKFCRELARREKARFCRIGRRSATECAAVLDVGWVSELADEWQIDLIGFAGMTWPAISQSKSIQTAVRCCFTVAFAYVVPSCSTHAATSVGFSCGEQLNEHTTQAARPSVTGRMRSAQRRSRPASHRSSAVGPRASRLVRVPLGHDWSRLLSQRGRDARIRRRASPSGPLDHGESPNGFRVPHVRWVHGHPSHDRLGELKGTTRMNTAGPCGDLPARVCPPAPTRSPLIP